MSPVSATTLLEVWERGLAQPPGRRSAVLMTLDGWDDDPSIGERDRRLVAQYRRLFGPRAEANAVCPSCGEIVECDLEMDAFAETKDEKVETVIVRGDLQIRWQSPTTSELTRISALGNPAAARERLLRFCVLEVLQGGRQLSRGDWPETVADLVGQAIERSDPLSAAEIGLQCPACRAEWVLAFDIGAFLWAEIDRTARQLMTDVIHLATAYGWSESSILSMTAVRRAAYRNMIPH